jgi:hypothetical protein
MSKLILSWFYRAMVVLSEYELAIAEATSSNFNYVMRCREDLRSWQKELRLFELRSA